MPNSCTDHDWAEGDYFVRQVFCRVCGALRDDLSKRLEFEHRSIPGETPPWDSQLIVHVVDA